MTIDQIIDLAPQNHIIQNTLMKMHFKLNYHRNPVCSVSGGSDSDTMMDIIERVRGDRPVIYVFFDTGIEYQATHRHLEELESKYGVEILRRQATMPVPKGCKQYGQPFISKEISDKIKRLQRHGFKWENRPHHELLNKYPNCKAGVDWWCNARDVEYGVGAVKFLKEFMIENPPIFPISNKCCEGAKKNPSGNFEREMSAGIKILGLRSVEGGVRATSFSSCFSSATEDTIAQYRPLWFWSDADKREYKDYYNLTYSDCYEAWGFKRTGCAGCPFNSRFEDDLLTMQQYEPKLYLAANNIFGDSYEYTRTYRRYKTERMKKEKLNGQTTFEELNMTVCEQNGLQF